MIRTRQQWYDHCIDRGTSGEQSSFYHLGLERTRTEPE